MKKISIIICLLGLFVAACGQEKIPPKTWKIDKTTLFDEGVSPIGLAFQNNQLWVTDGDNNRLVQVNLESGKIEQSFDNFERPMHLASHKNELFIPEYGSDKITIFTTQKRDSLPIPISMDAPAGVDIAENGHIAIADFYNHQVLLFYANKWLKIGQKGKQKGEFHYPTDVQIVGEKLYVADAYNHQVQVFDMAGKHLQTIGKEAGMNAATGIFVGKKQLFVTDFENNRVLIFDLNGELKQIISENLNNPTDLVIHDEQLFVINYKGKSFNQYKFQ